MKKPKIKIVCDDQRYFPKENELLAQIPISLGNVSRIVLNHRCSTKIKTGVKITLPEGFRILVSAIDELAEKGLIISNMVPQISASGEISIQVINVGRELIEIKDGDSIAKFWLSSTHQFNIGN